MAKDDGTLLAKLFEESSDGANGAFDLIEVTSSRSLSSITFVQLDYSQPSDASVVGHPSRRTKGLRMDLDRSSEDPITGRMDGKVSVRRGPTGTRNVEYDVICVRRPLRG